MQDDSISQADWTLVQRYLIGSVTPAETDTARALVQRDPRLRTLVNVLQTTALVADSPFVNAVTLKRRIDSTRIVASSSAVRPWASKSQPLRRWIWPTAAAIVLSVGIAAGWNAGVRQLTRREAVAASIYTTGNAQRANITLPDGSTVALNVASRLEVPADYMTGDHTVCLVGEGLFTVVRHESTPFVVEAGTTTTRVLGTRFVVRHYPSDSATMVAVQDGKVAVRSVVLTAGRQMDIPHTGLPTLQGADPAQFSFADGVLTLNGVRLSDAIPQLDRWYDADIRVADSELAGERITVGLRAGTLSDLAEFLTLTLNVRVVRDGRVLTLVSR